MSTNKGLHALNLIKHPEAAYLLVNEGVPPPNSATASSTENITADHHLQVNTVRDNYDGLTKHQIKNAARARRLMSMVATPSTRDF